MKLTKFRIAVLVLIVATIIYAVAFIQSVQAYNQWKQAEIERWNLGDFGPHYPPFLASKFGRPYLMPTIWLMLIWMFAAPFIITKKWDGRLAAFFLISAVCIPSFIVITRA